MARALSASMHQEDQLGRRFRRRCLRVTQQQFLRNRRERYCQNGLAVQVRASYAAEDGYDSYASLLPYHCGLCNAFWRARRPSCVSSGAGTSADGVLIVGFSYGGRGNPTDKEAKTRAIGNVMEHGGLNPRIIASTSRRGFGVVLVYQRSDGKRGYTASVGAATQQDAINDAARKAKAAGGSKAEIYRAWADVPRATIKL